MHVTRLSAAVLAAMLAMAGAMETACAQDEIKPPGRRIVGGEDTEIADHPWQVALQLRGRFFCSGSLVAERWVLTAAHCFAYSHQSGDWRAKAGATDHVAQGVWAPVARVVVHPDYDPATYENDIALIQLSAKPAGGRVIPRVDGTMDVPVGVNLEITGWGATEEGGKGSTVLQKVEVPHADRTACNAPDAYNGRVTQTMICAGDPEGGRDACQGDSGGPLVWRPQGMGPFLLGVVSWGEGCARELRYGVYTRVSAYQDWIDETMKAGGL